MNLKTPAKPFLKWAGGKGRLIPQLVHYLPPPLKQGGIDFYCEPFLGGGAFFFHIMQNYRVKQAILGDVNPDLVLGYTVIQKDSRLLIDNLGNLEDSYINLNEAQRREFYNEVRKNFNQTREDFSGRVTWAQRAWRVAQFIFLNRTCYNGLYRLNRQGEFNVPWGRYKNPRINDCENIREVSRLLANTELVSADFCLVIKTAHHGSGSFVYFDPPYRPLSPTAGFNHYHFRTFGDSEQKRLADYFCELDKRGFFLMLSNSDPQNIDPCDVFFDLLYRDYNIRRIKAPRSINSRPEKRGPITEILVTNYGS